MRLLVTRPQAEAERTAARLKALGHDVVTAPLLTIELQAQAPIADATWSAILMTSANAARAIASHPLHARLSVLPVFTVGSQTAQAAREAGFADVISADGDAIMLTALVSSKLPRGARCLYLAGNDRSREIGDDLAAHGIAVQTVVVYAAHMAAMFPAGIASKLAAGEVEGILHYSARTATAFASCAQAAGIVPQARALTHYCLSEQVAAPLSVAGYLDLRIASHPDEDALLRLLAA